MGLDEDFTAFERYWPLDGEFMFFKDIHVRVKREMRRNFFTVREFEVNN